MTKRPKCLYLFYFAYFATENEVEMEQAKGDLMIRVQAMPKDQNPAGDIFGGWLLSQMDIAAGAYARKLVKDRVVTVAVQSISFKQPVYTGDMLCCYCRLVSTGRTSITINVEAYADRSTEQLQVKVTEGEFVFVKVDAEGNPSEINRNNG